MPTVLITGASRGVGRAVALHLLSRGWTVFAGVRTLASAPAGTIPVELNITNDEHLATLSSHLPDRLDAVINNAGIVVSGPVEALTSDGLRRQLDANVVAQIAVTTAVLPAIRVASGRIVYMNSLSGRVSTPLTGAYNASKFALEALADAQRVELRPWGIRVISIEPGPVDTDMWRDAPAMIAELCESMTPQMNQLYRGHLAGMDGTVKFIQRTASPAQKVALVVEKALVARNPRARYPVGVATKLQIGAVTFVPTALFDRAVARIAGIRTG